MTHIYCGECGAKGHNVRTCPEVNPEAAARRLSRVILRVSSITEKEGSALAVAIKRRVGRVCGECNKKGHNIRTCPVLHPERTSRKKTTR